MSENSSLSAEIAAMVQKLDAIEDNAMPASPVRFIVATDWSDAAIPLTLLKGFRAIVPPDMGVPLAFALPHEPTEADVQGVRVLVEGTDEPEDVRALEVLSFEEAGSQPYDAAVGPEGECAAKIAQVGGLIVRMHDVVRRMDARSTAGVDSWESTPFNRGDGDVLRRRLSRFSG